MFFDSSTVFLYHLQLLYNPHSRKCHFPQYGTACISNLFVVLVFKMPTKHSQAAVSACEYASMRACEYASVRVCERSQCASSLTHRQLVHVSLQHALQVQLLQLPLQTGRQAGVHGGAPRKHDVFVELRPDRGEEGEARVTTSPNHAAPPRTCTHAIMLTSSLSQAHTHIIHYAKSYTRRIQ